MYTKSRHEAKIDVKEYLENYVDVDTFLKACKACPNFDQTWACPPYTFDVIHYWKQYESLQLLAVKMTFSDDMLNRTYTQKEIDQILEEVIWKEKGLLSRELMELEKKYPGSVSLSAGSCQLCKNGCTKPQGQPCRFPEQMRYSIESLGGNVGLTIEKLMGLKLEWIQEGKLPHHFVLVCGLLIP